MTTVALEHAYRELERIGRAIDANKQQFYELVNQVRKNDRLSPEGKKKTIQEEYDQFLSRHNKLKQEFSMAVQQRNADLRDIALSVKGEEQRAAVARVMAIQTKDELDRTIQIAETTNDAVLKRALATRGYMNQEWGLYSSMAEALAEKDESAKALLEFERGFGKLSDPTRKMELSMVLNAGLDKPTV